MNHRLLRVKELIRRELGMILERNFAFSGALVTIHDVDITPDLKQCFVFVGVFGKDADWRAILKKLNEARGMIQRELFKRVILKYSPSLTFKYDNSVERGVKVLRVIENLPEPLAEGDYDLERVTEDEEENPDRESGAKG